MRLHAEPGNRAVLLFMNTQERVDAVIAEPLVMIASDGEDGHPRNAGTFSRILARYVRERGSITLMDAIRKMALMPAQRLEKSTVAARRKGRLQEGADADIVVFDSSVGCGSLDLRGAAETKRGHEVRDRGRHRSHRSGQAQCQYIPGEGLDVAVQAGK